MKDRGLWPVTRALLRKWAEKEPVRQEGKLRECHVLEVKGRKRL